MDRGLEQPKQAAQNPNHRNVSWEVCAMAPAIHDRWGWGRVADVRLG